MKKDATKFVVSKLGNKSACYSCDLRNQAQQIIPELNFFLVLPPTGHAILLAGDNFDGCLEIADLEADWPFPCPATF